MCSPMSFSLSKNEVLRPASCVLLALAALAALAHAGRSTQDAGLASQTRAQADTKSAGCLTCHKSIEPMHASPAVRLGCTDCHGGNAAATTKDAAHVKPRHPEIWRTSANPPRTYTALLQESPEFVKFVNPGDLRVAEETCGGCHQKEVNAVPRSTMTTSSVFWTAAVYANGIFSRKTAILGESYSRDGKAQAIKPITPPTPEQIAKGALPQLVPLPRW